MMWSHWGWSLGGGVNFYFSQGSKIEFFWHYQIEKACSLVQTFVSFVYTYTLPIHRSVHMTRRFVVQGCPTLISTNHVTLLITVVLKLNNSASNSVRLNEFHIATCAALNLVCLHRATLLGIHLANKQMMN